MQELVSLIQNKTKPDNLADLGNKAADHPGVALLDPVVHVVVLLHLGLDNLK